MFRTLVLLSGALLVSARESPFASRAKVRVLVFVRTDCPVTNRYAPELKRIASKYQESSVQFWLVYPDRSESETQVLRHQQQYGFPGTALLDPRHDLMTRSHARTAPEAAVFNRSDTLIYHGRIDNRWVSFGRTRPEATVHDLEDAIAATLQGRPVREASTAAIGCSLTDLP